MTIEADLFATLKNLVGSRVYRDIAPPTLEAAERKKGYITHQQVGGEAVNFIDSATIPSKYNGRYQINVWHSSRDAANALALQVENALRAATGLQTTVLSAPVATYEPDTELYGTLQDFSFWHS